MNCVDSEENVENEDCLRRVEIGDVWRVEERGEWGVKIENGGMNCGEWREENRERGEWGN